MTSGDGRSSSFRVDNVTGLGWFGAFFFTPLGIACGLLMIRRGDSDGYWIFGVSTVWAIIVLAFVV